MDKLIRATFYIILILLIGLPPFFSGGRDIFIEELIFVLIGLLALVYLKLNHFCLNLNRPDRKLLIVLSVFLLLIWSSVFFSAAKYSSIIYYLKAVGYLILFFILSRWNFSRQELVRFFFFLLILGLILAAVGLYFYVVGPYNRLTSTFYWANSFAGYLILLLPLGGYLYLTTKYKTLSLGMIIFLFFCLVLTGSRGALMSLLVAGLIIGLIYRRQLKISFRPFLFFLLVMVAVVGLAYSFSGLKVGQVGFWSRATLQNQVIDLGSKIRLNYWQGAWEIFSHHILFGSGPGTFALVYPQYQIDVLSTGKYAHNWYLEFLAEAGLVGAAGLVVALIFVIRYFRKKRSLFFDNQNQSLFPWLGLAILASLIHNFLDFDWHFAASALLFVFLAGIFFGLFKDRSKGSANYLAGRAPGGWVTIIFTSLTIFLLVKGLTGLISAYNWQKAEQQAEKQNLIKSSQYLERSLWFNCSPQQMRDYLEVLLQQNKNSQAEYWAGRLVALDKQNSQNYFLLGRIYQQQGKDALAEQVWRQAISLDPLNHPPYYFSLSLLLIKQHRFTEAKFLLNQIIKFYPDNLVKIKEKILVDEPKENYFSSGLEQEISALRYLWQQVNFGSSGAGY